MLCRRCGGVQQEEAEEGRRVQVVAGEGGDPSRDGTPAPDNGDDDDDDADEEEQPQVVSPCGCPLSTLCAYPHRVASAQPIGEHRYTWTKSPCI